MKRTSPASMAKRALEDSGGAFLDPKLLLQALQRMSAGDFSVRLRGDRTGLEGKIADTFNQIVAANQKMAQELKRVGAVYSPPGVEETA